MLPHESEAGPVPVPLSADVEQERRLYRTILSNTPDFVYVFGLDHRFTYANDALLAMWGKTWDEAIGRNCLELGYEPWHAEMHDREIEQVVATRRPIRGEVPFNGTNGRRIYDYIFVPVIGANGEVEAVAGTTRDVTERRETEDALREREQRLRIANRLKDDFLATLSHELRTPLNAVLGWARILRLGAADAAQTQQALEAIERNALAQVRLVEELLDISAIISGKLQLKAAPVDLQGLVDAAVDTVRLAADAKRITLQAHAAPAPVVVTGDADRLRQVMWNLLANAIKFTPAGGRVEVTLRPTADEAEIVVRDSGDGIAAEFLPFVFERFRQADSSASRAYGGLGLGLSISRELVEAHGGRIQAHSDGPGRGATFTVRLPATHVA